MTTIRPRDRQEPAPYGLEHIREYIQTQMGSDDFELKVGLADCGHAAVVAIFPPDADENLLSSTFKNVDDWLKEMHKDLKVELSRPFMSQNAQIITFEEVHGLAFYKTSDDDTVQDPLVEDITQQIDFPLNFRNIDAQA